MWKALVAWLLLLLPAALAADQSDPRLDAMFERLRATEDSVEAEHLTTEIWRIWRQTGDLDAARLMREGLRAMDENRYRSALESFDALIREQPEFAEAWNRRATLYFLMGEYAESVDDILHVLELEPRHFGALSGLGLIYMQLGDNQAALASFEQALKINPHLPGARANIAHIRQVIRDQTI